MRIFDMPEKFENTIRKIGSTKFITAPVDMIRNGQKTSDGRMSVKRKNRLGIFVALFVIVLVGIVFYLYFAQY